MEALHDQRLVPAPRGALQKQTRSVAQFEAVDPGPIARLPARMNTLDRVREKRMKMVLYICNKLVHVCIIEGGQILVKVLFANGRSLDQEKL